MPVPVTECQWTLAARPLNTRFTEYLLELSAGFDCFVDLCRTLCVHMHDASSMMHRHDDDDDDDGSRSS